jgi:hypothetical protein
LLVGKPERKRPLGRPGRRWVNNIRMDLLELSSLRLALSKEHNREGVSLRSPEVIAISSF